MKTSHSSPNSVQANASAEPHWPARAVERRRAPQLVRVADRVRDRDLRLLRDLLRDQPHREDRRQVVRSGGLAGARAERRQRLAGEVGRDVHPMRRDRVLWQQELRRLAHGAILRAARQSWSVGCSPPTLDAARLSWPPRDPCALAAAASRGLLSWSPRILVRQE